MTRILIVEAAGNLWGSERALLDMLMKLKDTPDVHIAVCCPLGCLLAEELVKRNVLVLPYFIDNLHEKLKWQKLLASIGVVWACWKFRPQVLHLNQSGTLRVCLLAIRLFRLPAIAHIRIFEEIEYLASLGRHLSALRGVIAVSKWVRDNVRRYSFLDPIPCYQIYDCYDALTFAVSSSAKSRIICAGRIEPMKGQNILIQALSLLDSGDDCELECLIAGEGESQWVERLKAEAPTFVRWMGFVADMENLLKTCSVMAVTSHRETLGRVILEAWDAGCIPVVYAGSGGASEIVNESGGGILYAEQTPQSLALALSQALELTDIQRTQMIQSGRSWMAEKCNPALCSNQMMQILASVSL